MDATENASHLTQAQLLAHIAHLAQVGHLPAPREVRFAPELTQVHITVDSPDDIAPWAEWTDADDVSTETVTSWIAYDWHGWLTALWIETTNPTPMTPANLAAALLEG